MAREEICFNCRFWEADIDDQEEGECRRYPPVMHPHLIPDVNEAEGDAGKEYDQSCWGVFPRPCCEHWCGEYKSKEADSTLLPLDVVSLVKQLDPEVIRVRLDDIDRERDALLVLMRAALCAKKE